MGRFCADCKQTFAKRYFRRHKCTQNIEQYSTDSYSDEETVVKQRRLDNNHTVTGHTVESSSDGENVLSKESFEHHFQNILRKRRMQQNNLGVLNNDSELETSSDDSKSESEQEILDVDTTDDGTGANDPNEVPLNALPSIVRWIIIFLVMFQRKFATSDNALMVLLMFVKTLLQVLGGNKIAAKIPSNSHSLRKCLNLDKGPFIKYVSCRICYSLYLYDDCLNIVEGIPQSKTCGHVEFPNHSSKHLRKPCGNTLLKEVEMGGKKKLVPHKTYCYYPFQKSFKQLLERDGIMDLCEQWKSDTTDAHVLSDVHHGQIWKEFADPNRHDFLNQENTYGLMMNLDWYQPYKYVRYSVGVIYMAILNLPRTERFKRENVVIVGIIPHCKTEPKTNTFLKPLVDELLSMWNIGVTIKDKNGATVICRAALICVGCDIPACRKVSGFLGHSAKKGCHRCAIEFKGTVGTMDYGNFDRDAWPKRTYESHIDQVRQIKVAKTKGDREMLERRFGTRYSVLLELPYFDPIRMSIVDPMHNLFLGTAKHMLKLWKEKDIIKSEHFKEIQGKIDAFVCPSDIGRIPFKIESGFAAFTADQLKNWVILYSMYCLKNILPDDHLKCWQSFVLGCKILCSKFITHDQVTTADSCLMQFCKKAEELYGSSFITPNMHLHAHLKECILDFGPVYAFWLFSFERENGILGSYSVNNRDMEIQVMRKFIREMAVFDINMPDKYGEKFLPILKSVSASGSDRGTLKETYVSGEYDMITMSSPTFNFNDATDWSIQNMQIQIPVKTRASLTQFEQNNLEGMYRYLYGQDANIEICPTFFKSKEIYYLASIWGSATGRSHRSSFIVAHWPLNASQPAVSIETRFGKVDYYLQHYILENNVQKMHCIARVKWFKPHTEDLQNYYGKPVVVCKNMANPDGSMSYIPIQRVKAKCVMTVDKIRSKACVVLVPRDKYHV